MSTHDKPIPEQIKNILVGLYGHSNGTILAASNDSLVMIIAVIETLYAGERKQIQNDFLTIIEQQQQIIESLKNAVENQEKIIAEQADLVNKQRIELYNIQQKFVQLGDASNRLTTRIEKLLNQEEAQNQQKNEPPRLLQKIFGK